METSGLIHKPLLKLASQARVRIEDLKETSELNGVTGVVVGDLDHATGRWTIQLDSDKSLKQLLPQNIKILHCNTPLRADLES